MEDPQKFSLERLSTPVKIAASLGLVGLAAAFVQFVPKEFWFKCPIHATTGFYCTGCGGQRWFSSLIHGDFEAAWNYNQLLSLSPLLFLIYFGVSKLNPGRRTQLVLLGTMFVILAAFTIWRNLPPQVNYLAR